MQNFKAEFDQVTVADCRRRGCSKWHRYGDDTLGAWIADMDFPPHPTIRNKLNELADHGDLGYTPLFPNSGLPEAFAAFAQRRYGWEVAASSIGYLTDVVQGIYMAILAFSRPGEGIISTTPIYPPFLAAIANCDRQQVLVPFHKQDSRFELDMDQLEAACAAKENKLLLLCNPHNPTGRVLKRKELERIAEIALRHNVIVISDEIHSDLIYEGEHIPFLSLGPEVKDIAITMTSATKSFNIAGLRTAICIFGSEKIRQQFYYLPPSITAGLNVAGLAATRFAWEQGDEWLDSLVSYLKENRDYALQRINQDFHNINVVCPESTYLMWLDCSAAPFAANPHEHFLEKAKVALNPGVDFGPGGEGYVRLNFATSRQILSQILDQMEATLTDTKPVP
jgi:cystathionine beta-lyase